MTTNPTHGMTDDQIMNEGLRIATETLARIEKGRDEQPERLAKALRGARHGFQQHALLNLLEGDVEQVVIVGQAHTVSPCNAGRSAQPRK